MLVLGREEGESFIIGEAIITVTFARGGTSTIGIEAPRSVTVMRKELVDPVTFEGLKRAAREGHR